MDVIQRNFGMMAEKIDRMRSLRERCDNYVRMIKLTLDETIQEQNSLLDGSAIHHRLKYLGAMDLKPSGLSPKTYGTHAFYPKRIGHNHKYVVLDDGLGVKKRNDTDLKITGPYSANTDCYNFDEYKPQSCRYVDPLMQDYTEPYYVPMQVPKKYGDIVNYRTPSFEDLYYFPASRPIAQYPKHTAERFYRRKPVERYTEEEAPCWSTRVPKPVRVVERKPMYPTTESYTDRKNHLATAYYRPSRYHFPNDHDPYRTRYDHGDDYYDHPEYGYRYSVTRPVSPVYYSRSRCNYADDPEDLLEKTIRDYVWGNGTRESRRMAKYESSPRYGFVDKWPWRTREGEHQVGPQIQDAKEIKKSTIKNSVTLEGRRISLVDDDCVAHPDDGWNSEKPDYTHKPAMPPKRISFDLNNSGDEQLPRKLSQDCSIETGKTIGACRSSAVKRESISKTMQPEADRVRRSSTTPRIKSHERSLAKTDTTGVRTVECMGQSFESDKFSRESFDEKSIDTGGAKSYASLADEIVNRTSLKNIDDGQGSLSTVTMRNDRPDRSPVGDDSSVVDRRNSSSYRNYSYKNDTNSTGEDNQSPSTYKVPAMLPDTAVFDQGQLKRDVSIPKQNSKDSYHEDIEPEMTGNGRESELIRQSSVGNNDYQPFGSETHADERYVDEAYYHPDNEQSGERQQEAQDDQYYQDYQNQPIPVDRQYDEPQVHDSNEYSNDQYYYGDVPAGGGENDPSVHQQRYAEPQENVYVTTEQQDQRQQQDDYNRYEDYSTVQGATNDGYYDYQGDQGAVDEQQPTRNEYYDYGNYTNGQEPQLSDQQYVAEPSEPQTINHYNQEEHPQQEGDDYYYQNNPDTGGYGDMQQESSYPQGEYDEHLPQREHEGYGTTDDYFYQNQSVGDYADSVAKDQEYAVDYNHSQGYQMDDGQPTEGNPTTDYGRQQQLEYRENDMYSMQQSEAVGQLPEDDDNRLNEEQTK
ncbi:uncharacterized protein LOC126844974 [Adelges cooleyi]|uniref:uncharacterized protein LOC126844974 n=1 Tax=Adelges cooleyi TaxID=133065 RepID=UPI00218084A4|nr:uncharacterized protein LOC126844974 [Adelges cooleyi]XP_050439470.1 uncharacterized protein LOC126844974 [Adelges cooleyi]XP_050439471.1 uncharacterized protein LOC126844974 [Adelges cooleyi]